MKKVQHATQLKVGRVYFLEDAGTFFSYVGSRTRWETELKVVPPRYCFEVLPLTRRPSAISFCYRSVNSKDGIYEIGPNFEKYLSLFTNENFRMRSI